MRFSGVIRNHRNCCAQENESIMKLTIVTSDVRLMHMHAYNLFCNHYSLTHFSNSKFTFLTQTHFSNEIRLSYSKLTF